MAQSPTPEPAAGEPAAGEPAAGEPAAGEPAAGEPAAGEPAAGEPAAGEPAAGDPLDTLVGAPLAALRWLDRQPSWAVGIPLVLVAGTVAALLFDPRIYHGGDNALYWALGKSIVEHGEYRNLVAPGAPFETSIPWGFPLLIAAVMAVVPGGTTPEGYLALKAVPFACAIAAMACLWGLLQHLLRGQRGLAALTMLLLAVNFHLMCYASLLLSEAPYLLVSLAALWAFVWYQQRIARHGWWVIPAATLSSCAYLVRPVGIALVAALLVTLAWRRRWMALGAALLVTVVIAGSWHVRSALVPSDQENLYLSHVSSRSKFQVSDERVDLGGLVERVEHNAEAYAGGPLSQLVLGDRESDEPPWLAMFVFGALVALGAAACRGRAGPTLLYLALYLCVLLLWLPEAVRIRYLVIGYTLILPLALLGLWRLALHLSPRAAGWAVVLATSAGLWAQISTTATQAWTYHEIRQRFAAGDTQAGRGEAMTSYVAMCRWIADNTEADAVLAARKPRLAYLYSGHQAERLTYATDPDEVFTWLVDNHIDVVLLDDLYTSGGSTRYRLEDTLREHQRNLLEIWRTDSGDRVMLFAADPRDLRRRGASTTSTRHKPRPARSGDGEGAE